MRFFVFASFACAVACGACGGEVVTGGDSGLTNTDAGLCVAITPTAFDTSCVGTSDCIGISDGNICAGYNCLCPTATINVSSQAQYQAQLAKVTPGKNACGCPLLGTPKCIASQCVFCPNPALKGALPPGCPDGGP